MYWILIMFMLYLIMVSGDYLMITFGISTLVISVLMIVIYPLVIAPMFNDYD